MKLEYPKEWFLRSADIEGAAEIGAGIPHWDTDASTCGVNHPASRIAFGRFVELWRRNKGWNSEKLAEEAGLDPEEILEIEHDPHSELEPDAVFKLAQVFGVTPKKLYVVAGLIEPRTSVLRDKVVRFAARSESVSKLNDVEREALEAFVAALSELPPKSL